MARVTIEDCLPFVENRFALVLLASKRARQILLGATPLVSAGTDKPTVLALREIAAGLMDQKTVDAIETQKQLADEALALEASVAAEVAAAEAAAASQPNPR